MLRAHIDTINGEVKKKEKNEKDSSDTADKLLIATYDCQDGARAAQCIKFTNGTSTVPHVFFNEAYIGDADFLIKMDQNDRPKLLSMLRAIADIPTDFPPTPEAAMIKVTETEAFSSQPTLDQLRGLRTFGFRSVINCLCSTTEAAYVAEESTILRGNGIEYSCISFVNCPKQGFEGSYKASESIQHIMKTCPKPVLVHCDTGRRSCALVLLLNAVKMGADIRQVHSWGADLGHNLETAVGPHGWVSIFIQKYFEKLKNVKSATAVSPAVPPEVKKSAPPLPPKGTLKKGISYKDRKKKELPKEDPQKAWREKYKIHAASCNVGEIDLIELLERSSKENIDALDNQGWNAMHYAAWNGMTQSISLLIDHGASVNTETADSHTALHFAAGMGHVDCVEILCDSGADIEAKDDSGFTPLIVAERTAKDEQFKNQNGIVEKKSWDSIYRLLSGK